MLKTIRPTVRFASCSLLLVGAGLVTGCSGASARDGSSSSNAALEADLDAENGNMTPVDEQPMFNDVAVEELAGFEDAQIDATDFTTEVAAQPGATQYHLALLWGHLPPPRDAVGPDIEPSAADWTGSVSVSAGAIQVKKTLLLDKRDSVSPRTDPTSVSFVSHTLPFVDGLYVRVVIPAGAAPVLHFQTPSLTQDIDLSQITTKEGSVSRIAGTANGLGTIGYEDVAGCSRGLMFGRWTKEQANLGRLRGQVIDGNGDRIGHVRGIWGHAPKRNEKVFFGKYISTTGGHKGLFGGLYDDGHFGGIWGGQKAADVGRLEGIYSDGYDKADRRGLFLGRWTEKCQ
jgi:hypothetical protein